MKSIFTKFVRDDSGATLVEYAAALAVVLIVGVLALSTLGTQVGLNFNAAETAITPA